MDVTKVRLGLIVPTLTPVWTGTADGAASGDFVLSVTTATGTLASTMAGLVLVRAGVDLVRIRDASSGAGTITLAETPVEFAASDALSIYNLRLPFPRYQRISGGVVYKDYDIAFPGSPEESLPPAITVTPSAAWLDTDEQETFSADGSQSMYPSAGALTYTWTPGTDGTVHSTSPPEATISWSSEGFRYLNAYAEDANAVGNTRYVWVQVGGTATNILEFESSYSIKNGWSATCSVDGSLPSILLYHPVSIVDLDTKEVVYNGFVQRDTITTEWDRSTTSFSILSVLDVADLLQTHAFVVEDVADPVSTPPDSWYEVAQCTVERAAWFLLFWHSTIPDIINVEFGDVTARRIKGQKFTNGTITSALNSAIGSAMYAIRSSSIGGWYIYKHPLYASSDEWDGDPGDFEIYDLSDEEDRESDIVETFPHPSFTDIRASGIYHAVSGNYTPVIVRAPSHPANWGGRSASINGLAPLTEAEILGWAERHYIIENEVSSYSVSPLVDINPLTYALCDLDNGERICIESMRYAYSATDMVFSVRLSGRAYGTTVATVSVPVPDPIEIPAPDPPQEAPYIPYLPPPESWPVEVWAGTIDLGMYYTEDFSGPSGSQPTWTIFNTGLDTTNINGVEVNRKTRSVFCLSNDSSFSNRSSLYRLDNSRATWERVLTEDDATTMLGADETRIVSIYVDQSTGYLYALINMIEGLTNDVYLLESQADGKESMWAEKCRITVDWQFGLAFAIINSDNDIGIYAGSKTGGGGSGRVYYDEPGAYEWDMSDLLGGNFLPSAYYNPYDDTVYASSSSGYLKILDRTTGLWGTPSVGYDLEELMARDFYGYPRMTYADGYSRVLAYGTGGGATPYAIYVSTDGWDTHSTAGACGRIVDTMYSSPYDNDAIILARYSSGTVGAPHVVFITDDDGATTPTERAGVDPQNTSTSVSIPYNCGGICDNGIVIVK